MDDTEDDRRIRGWLDLWLEASATCQSDVACEAATHLDHLLRQPVKQT